MTITDLVAPEAILPALKVNSKKQALQELAARAASLTGQNERAVFEVLLQREKLGTTAVGYGVAIPHGKLPKLEKLFGLFARLERPIDFEAMDGQPVDLVFLLLAPEGAGADHLKALARIARLLRDQDVAKKLRASRDAQAIYSVLALPPASAACSRFESDGARPLRQRTGKTRRVKNNTRVRCPGDRHPRMANSLRRRAASGCRHGRVSGR
jgi:PTS system nitrogen regulatory IIA component